MPSFDLTVVSLFAPGNLPDGIAGVSYSYDLSEDTATYVASGLPPGLSMSTSGLITGTPTTLGTYLTIVTATLSGQDYIQAYSFVIKNAGSGGGGGTPGGGGETPPAEVQTTIPPLGFRPEGLIIPTDAQILQGARADMVSVFGPNLNDTQLSTPQGQLASTLTAVVSDGYTQIAKVVNGMDPRYSAGAMQDAIGYLYFLERNPAEATVVTVNCIGQARVPIPVGATIRAGDIYACIKAVTIPAGGQVTTQFANIQTGPIVAAASGYTIYQTIPGWDRAEFVSAVTGANVESRQEFEYRRNQSVAKNAKGTPAAIKAEVLAVPGVLDVYVVDNPKGEAVVVGGQLLKAHSVYVAAIGGDSKAVAEAIWRKKDGGCDYNGNTTVVVEDKANYSAPYPQYPVTFQIPPALPIHFAVQIASSPNLPANIVELVRNAIISAFNGGDGGARARIGSTIYASRYYAPVAAISPSDVSILTLQIGTSTANLPSITVPINAVPTVAAADIDVDIV